MTELMTFVKDLYKSQPTAVSLNFFLQLALGLAQGLSVLMLLPLLTLAGVFDDVASANVWQQWLAPIDITTALLVFAVVIGVHALARRWQNVLSVEIENNYANTLRQRLYHGLCQATWCFLSRQKSAHLTHALTHEVYRVANMVKLLFELLCTLLLASAYVVVALMLHPGMLLLALSCGLALFLLLRPLTRQANQHGVAAQQHSQGMFSDVMELLAGMKTIKSQAMEYDMKQRFDGHCDDLAKSHIGFAQINGATAMYHELATVVFVSLIVYVALAVWHIDGALLLMLLLTFSRLMPRLSSILRLFQQLLNQLPAHKLLFELQQQCDAHAEDHHSSTHKHSSTHQQPQKLALRQGIVVENISFYHGERNTLQQVSLQWPSQATIAFVGHSGAGKTTLADIIAGLVTPQQGQVLIDGQPLNGRNRLAWRRSISYVSQDAFLFHDSIRHNLLWLNCHASETQLWQALEMAAAKTFVEQLPQGLDTLLGDRGITLSGGERQRIALARALLNQPSLLILDEATSALDVENERLIQQAIDSLHGQLSIVLIAHRLSTVRCADKIYVMAQGQIIEQGTWSQLSEDQAGQFAKMLTQ